MQLIIAMINNGSYRNKVRIDNTYDIYHRDYNITYILYHIISYQLPLSSEEIFEAIIELSGGFHEVVQLIDALCVDPLEHGAVLIQLKIDGDLHCIQLTEVTTNIDSIDR
jgi:hypothetical protein